MDPQRFRRIEELFDQALDLGPAEREAFLQRACEGDEGLLSELQELLAADASPTWTAADTTAAFVSAGALTAGAQVGPFSVVRRIGEGGMGTVYEATQQRPQRTVALKTLRAGADTPKARRRFEYESDLLGRLQHPGIAQIFEAGTFTEGGREVPYLAMELLVDAAPLDEHLERSRQDLRGTLRLFAEVCDAVRRELSGPHAVSARSVLSGAPTPGSQTLPVIYLAADEEKYATSELGRDKKNAKITCLNGLPTRKSTVA